MNRRQVLSASVAAFLFANGAGAAAPGPRDIVVAVYRVEGVKTLIDGPQPIDARHRGMFFDKRINALLAADDKLAAKQGQGHLQFDPISNSQNYEITELNIGAETIVGNTARVEVTFVNSRRRQKLIYELTREGGVWRISNILCNSIKPSWDLVSELQGA